MRNIHWWPPYLGAGISVLEMNEDITSITVGMRLTWWNQNIVKVHFGGSLYAMCDPFFMLILMLHLGRDFIVWDKAATIRFKRPGTGSVKVTFAISQLRIAELRQQALSALKVEPVFTTTITNEEGKVVAEVEKLLDIRVRPVVASDTAPL